ncbi:lytic murein transglycosylase [Inquilinus sp. CAU 1745]|uniref:lytic murein transglycosylase n=1 Tax=Inquilinus sp. CAU 1745 TaxID=3140369 RepID=UPI00325B9CF5
MGHPVGRRISLAFASLIGLLWLAVAPAAMAQQVPFGEWLRGVRAEAAAQGVSDQILDTAFSGLEPNPRVIELDRAQPEGSITFAQYMDRVISEVRVTEGRRLVRQHEALLREVAAQYGVQPRFIVALWGLETNFGGNTGGFSVIRSLATLAYDGRRADYFREELLNALMILEQGHIAPGAMQGSWAGAMGQSQFMPSSFLGYAEDYDGDGRRDIWTTTADVFASAANYLAEAGWDDSLTWGRQVDLPAGIDPALVGLERSLPLSRWADQGVRRAGGGALPAAALEASLIRPDGAGGPAFLVYENFNVLMRWNRSTYFATSIGILSDLIGSCQDGPRGYSCVY